MRDANSSHGGAPGDSGDEVGAVRGDVRAQPQAGFMQAGFGGAGGSGDLPGGLVGVVEQGDGLPLPGGQAGDRAAQHVGAIQVLSRRQAERRGRVQVLGPVAEQGERRAAPLGAADVGKDAAQPAANRPGSRSRSSAMNACKNASCTASSASPGCAHSRAARARAIGRCRSTSSRNAAGSPSRASRTRSPSGMSMLSFTFTAEFPAMPG